MKTINVNQTRNHQGKRVKVVTNEMVIVGTIEGTLFDMPASTAGTGVCNGFSIKDESDITYSIFADSVKEIILLDTSL